MEALPVSLEWLRGRPTISVVEAGEILGLCRNKAYAAARKGQIPVIRFGRKMRVSTLALVEMLKNPQGYCPT